MNPEVKKLWVEALRGGKYVQGKGKLHYISKDGQEKFCCLGVLCDLYPGAEWEYEDGIVGVMEGNSGTLTEAVRTWAGLNNSDPFIIGIDCMSVINDDRGYPFDAIADLIEDQL